MQKAWTAARSRRRRPSAEASAACSSSNIQEAVTPNMLPNCNAEGVDCGLQQAAAAIDVLLLLIVVHPTIHSHPVLLVLQRVWTRGRSRQWRRWAAAAVALWRCCAAVWYRSSWYLQFPSRVRLVTCVDTALQNTYRRCEFQWRCCATAWRCNF